jgi:hypothetical protein
LVKHCGFGSILFLSWRIVSRMVIQINSRGEG